MIVIKLQSMYICTYIVVGSIPQITEHEIYKQTIQAENL